MVPGRRAPAALTSLQLWYNRARGRADRRAVCTPAPAPQALAANDAGRGAAKKAPRLARPSATSDGQIGQPPLFHAGAEPAVEAPAAPPADDLPPHPKSMIPR